MIKQIILILLISIQIASAATIQGTIYNLDLNVVENTIIEVDTTPKQTIIVPDGIYSIELPPGEYTLTTQKFENKVLIEGAEEKIIIKEEGTFNLDLILFPVIDGEIIKIDEESPTLKPISTIPWILVIILIIIVIIILNKKRKTKPEKKEEPEIEKDLQTIIKILKESDNRITQKELRKKLNLSEAKVSLMVADLESQGKIKKIKRGRSNIIVLERK